MFNYLSGAKILLGTNVMFLDIVDRPVLKNKQDGISGDRD
jgi:hypothetical protein